VAHVEKNGPQHEHVAALLERIALGIEALCRASKIRPRNPNTKAWTKEQWAKTREGVMTAARALNESQFGATVKYVTPPREDDDPFGPPEAGGTMTPEQFWAEKDPHRDPAKPARVIMKRAKKKRAKKAKP
jgi:hypothetical protein